MRIFKTTIPAIIAILIITGVLIVMPRIGHKHNGVPNSTQYKIALAGTHIDTSPDSDFELTAHFSNEYVYLKRPFEVTIECSEIIEDLYYTVLYRENEDYSMSGMFWHGEDIKLIEDLNDKKYDISIATDRLWRDFYELQVAVKTKNSKLHKGITVDFTVLPQPEVTVEYDRHNWESEQTITVIPQIDIIENVEYIDANGESHALAKVKAEGYGHEFKLQTILPPPESQGTLVFTSNKYLVHEEVIRTYPAKETRVYFQGRSVEERDGKPVQVNCIFSNSLDGMDLVKEFEVPDFYFEDEYYSSFMDSLDPQHREYHIETKVKGARLIAISPDNNKYIFEGNAYFPLIGENIVHGRNVKRMSINLVFIYDTDTGTYEYKKCGYYYNFNTAVGEGSDVIWDDFIRLKPMYWKSNSELIMLEAIAEDRLWSRYEAENDPKIKIKWTLSPPESEIRIVCFNVDDQSITELENHTPLRLEISVSDDVTGITGWYGPYDTFDVRSVAGEKTGFYYLSDKTGEHKWTAEQILEQAGLSQDENHRYYLSYHGATNYQNIPRALIMIVNSLSKVDPDDEEQEILGSHYQYVAFNPETGDVDKLYERDYFPMDELSGFAPPSGEMSLGNVVKSCHPDAGQLPLFLAFGYFFQFNMDGTITRISEKNIAPYDEIKYTEEIYFIK